MIHNNVFVPLVFFAILTSLWVDSNYTNAAFQNQKYKQEHLTLFLPLLCIEWKSNAMPIQNPNNVTLQWNSKYYPPTTIRMWIKTSLNKIFVFSSTPFYVTEFPKLYNTSSYQIKYETPIQLPNSLDARNVEFTWVLYFPNENSSGVARNWNIYIGVLCRAERKIQLQNIMNFE